MKKKMSRNDVYELAGDRPILRVPYYAAQRMVKNFKPVGYTAGVYGWEYDVYDCNDVVVITSIE